MSENTFTPIINAPWIHTMIIFSFIGLTISIIILIYGSYKIYIKVNDKPLIFITILLWLFNIFSLILWSIFRTNIIILLNIKLCQFIYIGNYLCYLIGKYLLHILLIYKLNATFSGSVYGFSSKKLFIFALFITIDFLIFTSLWLKRTMGGVLVGKTPDNIYVCTYFNSATKQQMTIKHKIWPILLGGQDFIVGIITLILYAKKLLSLATHANTKITAVYYNILKKLIICAFWAISSTFVFYTFAIPFKPNLTFLLPFDVTINNLCVLLMYSFGETIYSKICCICDKLLGMFYQHRTKSEIPMTKVFSNSNILNRQLTVENKISNSPAYAYTSTKEEYLITSINNDINVKLVA